jgi:hypothetical protein
MWKRFLPGLSLPLLLLTGCSTTFTNLTPHQQLRSTNNLYQLEVALTTRQASLMWDSIKPQIIVGTEAYPMRLTRMMTNRWEGLVPVPAGTGQIHYRYKFDFEERAFGHPQPDSATSPEYSLRIIDQ